MRSALHAEWTKLRTTAGPAWLLAATLVGTIAVSAGAAAAARCGSAGCHQDPVRISLSGVVLGQAFVALLAIQVSSGEYQTGVVRATMTATPRRWNVLLAKAVTVSGAVLLVGAIAALGSWLAGRIILPHSGFSQAHGYGPLSLADGPTARAALGSVLYLVLIGLLSLGAATAVRESAVAIGVVLGLLFVFPIAARLVTDPDWHRHLRQVAPMDAGLAIQNTVDLAAQPIGPWPGLGMLAAWSALMLVAGGLLLQLRDV